MNWVSDNTAHFTVSNDPASAGTVTWVADGSANLYAVLGPVLGSAVGEGCPTGFYKVGGRCAYDYSIDVSGLVDQPTTCGTTGAYYNDTWRVIVTAIRRTKSSRPSTSPRTSEVVWWAGRTS